MLDKFNEEIKSCKKCLSSKMNPVVGNLNSRGALFFVGLSPGRLGADKTGIPFTQDASGKLLREMLELFNINSYYITNLVKCNSVDNKGNNRVPNRIEINNCKHFLEKEIEIVNPIMIIPLGEKATKYFLGNNIKLKTHICKPIIYNNIDVCPLYHPGYVIRGVYKKNDYIDDFKNLIEFYNNYIEDLREQIQIRLDYIRSDIISYDEFMIGII